MHLIPTTFIPTPPRNHMHMHVRNTLTRRCAILHRYVEGFGGVEACESLLDSGDGLEEVGELGWGEVG
jgi:hypothetical protein